jgi:PEP-CTERM motif
MKSTKDRYHLKLKEISMANSIYQKLALATAATVLSLAVMETASVQAAIITYDFTVNITSGSLLGNQYSGFFSYDESAPSSFTRFGFIPYFQVSDFSFDFFGKTYTENDVRYNNPRAEQYPPFSYLRFANPRPIVNNPAYFLPGGELDQVKFYLTDVSSIFGGGSYFINLYPNSTFSFLFFDRVPTNIISSGAGTWKYTLRKEPPSTSVPEPGTVFGLSVLGLGWLLRKKKASFQA